MAGPFEGEVAVVTGSSRGIGKVIALQLAEDGADVVLTARVEQPIEGQPGWSLQEAAAEVRDAAVRSLVDKTLAEFGRIDILVNNAARLGGGGPFMNGDFSLFEEFLATNLRAPYLLAQLAAPHMAASGGGAIVNITSGAGRMPEPRGDGSRGGFEQAQSRPFTPPTVGYGYGITKAGLNRWCAAVAPELREQNIAIINVDPGLTITERNQLNPRPGADYTNANTPDITSKAIAYMLRDPMAYTGRVVVAKELFTEKVLA
jgi:NAD(P)-dependent dehydrogenase (short-subunit alcohol dehydrogenase family)